MLDESVVPAPEEALPEPKREPPVVAAREAEFADLQERVQKHYGAFGERAYAEEIPDRVVLCADNKLEKPTAWIIGGIALATTFLWFASHPTFANPGEWANSFRLDTAFAVVWMPLLAWAMVRLKLAKSLRIYLAIALFIEPFSEVMFKEMGEGGYWDSIMWPSSVAWFGTVKEFSGLPGASFSMFELSTITLLARAVWGRKPAGWTKPPAFAKGALFIFMGTMLSLAVLGLLKGGEVDWTFRQTIHMMQLPVVGLLLLYTLRVPEDLAAVGTTYVIAAVASQSARDLGVFRRLRAARHHRAAEQARVVHEPLGHGALRERARDPVRARARAAHSGTSPCRRSPWAR